MSSDLLSAFGASEISSPIDGQGAKPRLDTEDEEDEDFGDFEDVQKEFEDVGVQDKSEDLRTTSSNEVFSVSNPALDEHQGWAQPGQLSIHRPSSHDDEWGDFAGQEIMFDADQLDKLPVPTPKKLTKKQQIYAPVEKFDFDADDNWDPVEVIQAPIIPAQRSSAATKGKSSMDVPSQVPALANKKDQGPPPTNVPPPSVLLSVIANIFQNLSSKIKEIVTKDRASSDPYEALDECRIALLQKQMSTVRSSARIIAGRRLRWKRDAILSQSMKIGAAGQSGMKLSSVDKNETRREDQEVSEAVHIWKKQIGPLRSTIAKVNVHLSGEGLMIPDISETIPVRQGKAGEGAIKAPKCCFLCGVNRDERVAKVDVWVEDSFGEWWVDHWGHFDCVDFWNLEKGNLAQR